MVYRPKVDDKLCFVLMPFGHPFDSYYQKIIKPAASDAGLATLRSDEIYSTKAIISDIWARIWAARIVVADVTEKNPNVNYELGLCDALGVLTIIISGNVNDIPFDYKHRRCILYSTTEAGWDDKLRADLASTIRVALAEVASENELVWPYDTSILKEPTSGGVLVAAAADSRIIVIRGAKLVRDAIAHAFGPRGVSVAVSQTFGGTVQLLRGAQIAQGIRSSNPLEEKGIEQIRAAASTIYEVAGDCSKLVAILATGFMIKGQELIEKGFHPKDVVQSLGHSVENVLNYLHQQTIDISAGELVAVATTAAHSDRRTGLIVAEAMKRAGKDGVITIETADQRDTTLEIQEGTVFDRGYLSEYFVTDPHTLECVLENCLILLYQPRIQSMKDLLPLLEQVARTDKSLLIIADDVEGEALATLTVNKIRGTLKCAAVKSPGEGERRKALMEDIAVLTGGRFLSIDLGMPLANVSLADLGQAQKVIVKQQITTIVGGAGSKENINSRIRAIQAQIAQSTGQYETEKLQLRLAQLAGTVATIKFGSLTDGDLVQERYRLESAMHSARSAIERGVVIGGPAKWKICEMLGLSMQCDLLKNRYVSRFRARARSFRPERGISVRSHLRSGERDRCQETSTKLQRTKHASVRGQRDLAIPTITVIEAIKTPKTKVRCWNVKAFKSPRSSLDITSRSLWTVQFVALAEAMSWRRRIECREKYSQDMIESKKQHSERTIAQRPEGGSRKRLTNSPMPPELRPSIVREVVENSLSVDITSSILSAMLNLPELG